VNTEGVQLNGWIEFQLSDMQFAHLWISSS